MDNKMLTGWVKTGASACWRTLIVGMVLMSFSYVMALIMMHWQPSWVLWLCGGGDFKWPELQRLYLYFFSAFKFIMFIVFLEALFLTFWAKRLSRLE